VSDRTQKVKEVDALKQELKSASKEREFILHPSETNPKKAYLQISAKEDIWLTLRKADKDDYYHYEFKDEKGHRRLSDQSFTLTQLAKIEKYKADLPASGFRETKANATLKYLGVQFFRPIDKAEYYQFNANGVLEKITGKYYDKCVELAQVLEEKAKKKNK